MARNKFDDLNYVECRDTAELRALADKYDCDLVEPGDNHLLVDLDQGARLNESVLDAIRCEIGILGTLTWTSKSGNGRHVLLRLSHSLSITERIALQAA